MSLPVPNPPDLPVAEVLPALAEALASKGRAVLVAPPGAGKTTLAPLSLLDAEWLEGRRIVLVVPRRLAARAAARRMASLIGEEPGGRVGYAMRMDSRAGPSTRILVVTEGVLTRMILDDPELAGIGAVIFDEFHERSLDGDFGLALALDVAGALRPDLRLLVMSATLDGARVSALLGDAPMIESAGRAFPVELRHRPRGADERIEDAMAGAIRAALADESGSVLAFLPGQREIERTHERLERRVADNIDIVPLHGGLDGRAQDRAIRPSAKGRRKVVLATSIAETSITIEGVRVVIDSGLARVPRFEPDTGLTRLETVRVSRAAADQRAGRAGRTEAGVAIRLWRAEQTAALPAFAQPEILEADLSGLLLDCASFGIFDPRALAFLDPPPEPALAEARSLLAALGALDEAGRLTAEGEAMRRLSLPVRLAHMVSKAGLRAREAAELAVLLTERGLGGPSADLDRRMEAMRRDRSSRAEAARGLARRIAAQMPGANAARGEAGIGDLLVHAYPDRVAKARGALGRYVLANGRGAMLEETDPLAKAPMLVVADLQGRAQNARIAAAASIDEAAVRAALGDRVGRETVTRYDGERRSVTVRESERLGAIVLTERQLAAPSGDAARRAVTDAVRQNGVSLLPWEKGAATLRERLRWLREAYGDPWPAMDDASLIAKLDDWLAPFLPGSPSLDAIGPSGLKQALMSRVPYDLHRDVEQLAPTHFSAPSGSSVPIRYEGERPVLSIRVQELFGLTAHPAIAEGRVPLLLELLSPAHRPIQTTLDLPGFWRGSWADVRADMRGRYPKHVWPQDPAGAQATSRAKKRP